MPFSRQIQPLEPLRGEALTRAMVGIGMSFAGAGESTANVEDVLLFASDARLVASSHIFESILACISIARHVIIISRFLRSTTPLL